jgi:hypothetical protein
VVGFKCFIRNNSILIEEFSQVFSGLLRSSQVFSGLLRSSQVFSGLLRSSQVFSGHSYSPFSGGFEL